MPQAPVSVVIITRDSSATIGKVILNAFSIANEVVVVDTGSSDETRQLVVEHGAKLVCCPLDPFDYSTPRNVGRDAATNDFVFVLDSDEELEINAVPAIQAAIAANNYAKFYVLQQGYDSCGSPVAYSRYQARLMRKVYASQGLVYETFAPIGEFGVLEVVIKHHVDREKTGPKFEARKILAEKEITGLLDKALPSSPEDATNVLARLKSLYNGGITDGRIAALASRVYKNALAIEPMNQWLAVEMSTLLRVLNRASEGREALRRAERGPKLSHRYWHEVSLVACQLGDFSKALDAIRLAIQILPCSVYFKTEGTLLIDLGRISEALEALQKARDLLPSDPHVDRLVSMAVKRT